MAEPTFRILCGDVREQLATLASDSINVVVTSPPYYQLRAYKTPPQVWGGAGLSCDHEWGEWQEAHDVRELVRTGKTRTTDRFYGEASRRFDGNHQKHTASQTCVKCKARRCELGMESTPDEFADDLVEVFRALKRVLRKDGCLFVNMATSYASVPSDDGFMELRDDLSPEELAYVLSELGGVRSVVANGGD